MKKQQVVFLGGGMMAEAIIKGMLDAKLFTPENITAIDPSRARCSYLEEKHQIKATAQAQAVLATADIFFLAVKPQVFATAVDARLLAAIADKALIISIMAGINLSTLEAKFSRQPVLRVMPNTPLAVGAGMTVVSRGTKAQEKDMQLALAIFSACGQALELPESQLDAVTGLSGSGPGFSFVLIDALADAGVASGLPREIAIKLAAQTLLGSGKMVLESGLHPAQLRDQVTSPGGTTIAGIATLEEKGVRAGLMQAVFAAVEKSRSLSKL